MKREKRLKGIPISRGIVLSSRVYFQKNIDNDMHHVLSEHEINDEIIRYRVALRRSCRDIHRLQSSSFGEKSNIVKDILDSHLAILRDPVVATDVEEKIVKKKKSSEAALVHVVENYKKKFEKISEPLFRDRIYDIMDISKRVLRHLREMRPSSYFSAIPSKSIYIATDITPSEVLYAERKGIAAIVSEKGGLHAHTAIIARAQGIPYITNIALSDLNDLEIEEIIVDAIEGEIIINPNLASKSRYEQKKKKYQRELMLGEKAASFSCCTKDGYKLFFYSNIESYDVTSAAMEHSEGIGIFRTEFLLLSEGKIPSEERQYEIYRSLAQRCAPKPLIIRLFDFGRNKILFFPLEKLQKYEDHFEEECNPAFGCRGVRFLLKNRELLIGQLRAILRASLEGNIRILIPFVSQLEEIFEIRKMINQIGKTLKEKIGSIPIGSMIEIPSVALMIDRFVSYCDFLSIGTNDLLQFLFAADRQSPQRIYDSKSIDHVLIRLLDFVCRSVKREKKELFLCGEIASELLHIPKLIGLGITHFSVAPVHLARMKQNVRKISYGKEREKIQKLLHRKGEL